MRKKVFISIMMLWAISLMISAKVSAQSYLLGMIEVDFCNYDQTNKELDLTSKAGEKLPLCVEITNTSTEPISINIDFLDSIITSDSFKDRACNAADRPKKQFGNFMLPYEKEITIPAKETIQKNFFIQYPIGFSWLSHGCLAYHIIWWDINDGDMFTVRIRSIKYIDVLVNDTKATQAVKLSQSPTLTKIDNEYLISFWVTNEWNVPEKIHIVSILSNILGYQKEFVFDTTIAANSWIVFTTPNFILPIYGWVFQYKNTISYVPKFDFNITDGTQTSETYTGWIKKTQTLLFVWTRQSGVTIFIILLFIFWIFRPRKKRSQSV